MLNLALIYPIVDGTVDSTLCVKQWTNGFHICVSHSVTKKSISVRHVCEHRLISDFQVQAVSMKYCYSNYVGKTGIWYTCTVFVQLKITYSSTCVYVL